MIVKHKPVWHKRAMEWAGLIVRHCSGLYARVFFPAELEQSRTRFAFPFLWLLLCFLLSIFNILNCFCLFWRLFLFVTDVVYCAIDFYHFNSCFLFSIYTFFFFLSYFYVFLRFLRTLFTFWLLFLQLDEFLNYFSVHVLSFVTFILLFFDFLYV